MDHKALISSLTPQQRTVLTRKSNRAGLMHLACYFLVIFMLVGLVVSDLAIWFLFMPLLGIMLVFLFTLLHETSHHTPFESDWLNIAVGHLCGFIICLPATWFRYFHLAHHRYTQVPGKDPELAEPKPETIIDYLRYISGIPVWYGHVKTLIINASGKCDDGFLPNARKGGVTLEARVYLAGYGFVLMISIVTSSPILIYVWLVPMLLGQPFLRLYLLAEHGRCKFVENMLENTRTTYTNRLVRALAWNMPYHAEHHSYPTVPFHKLADLHQIIEPYLQETQDGYGSFHKGYVATFDTAEQ